LDLVESLDAAQISSNGENGDGDLEHPPLNGGVDASGDPNVGRSRKFQEQRRRSGRYANSTLN